MASLLPSVVSITAGGILFKALNPLPTVLDEFQGGLSLVQRGLADSSVFSADRERSHHPFDSVYLIVTYV